MDNNELRTGADLTDLDTACEEIFQLHKKHIIVNWTSETCPNMNPAIKVQAMNVLEDQNIIFRPTPPDSSKTQINPVVTSAPSFRDALTIMQEKGKGAPIKLTPIMKDGAPMHILEPPNKRKSNTLLIIIAIIVVLFLLFEFVPFYKWL
ncbi:MAG: hypothetical protein ACXVBF_05815 [Flavisolibacter sp.]